MVQSSGLDVTAVIPLLFLLATQISSAGREMDLTEVSGEHAPMIFSFLPEPIPFPEMGRFNFVHGMNLVVLAVAVFTSANLATGLQSSVLTFVSVVLWIVIPALEVDEYDQILANHEEGFHSFHGHVVGALVLSAVGIWGGELYLSSVTTGVNPERFAVFLLLSLSLGGVYYIQYLRCLSKELGKLNRFDHISLYC